MFVRTSPLDETSGRPEASSLKSCTWVKVVVCWDTGLLVDRDSQTASRGQGLTAPRRSFSLAEMRMNRVRRRPRLETMISRAYGTFTCRQNPSLPR